MSSQALTYVHNPNLLNFTHMIYIDILPLIGWTVEDARKDLIGVNRHFRRIREETVEWCNAQGWKQRQGWGFPREFDYQVDNNETRLYLGFQSKDNALLFKLGFTTA